jgi:hypothetical protein
MSKKKKKKVNGVTKSKKQKKGGMFPSLGDKSYG